MYITVGYILVVAALTWQMSLDLHDATTVFAVKEISLRHLEYNECPQEYLLKTGVDKLPFQIGLLRETVLL